MLHSVVCGKLHMHAQISVIGVALHRWETENDPEIIFWADKISINKNVCDFWDQMLIFFIKIGWLIKTHIKIHTRLTDFCINPSILQFATHLLNIRKEYFYYLISQCSRGVKSQSTKKFSAYRHKKLIRAQLWSEKNYLLRSTAVPLKSDAIKRCFMKQLHEDAKIMNHKKYMHIQKVLNLIHHFAFIYDFFFSGGF
jgi:hypothetical protein